MHKAKLGLIGIVGEEARRDLWNTMERVAQMGYEGIEGGEMLLEGDTDANLRRFHELGLQVLTASVGREQLDGDLSELIRKARTMETSRATVWWAPCDSRESVLREAQRLGTAGARLASEGITLCYHHHEHEILNVFGGVRALDLLAANTEASAVKFVIDIAWAAFGGENPARLIRQMQGRVASVHLKDLARLDERGHFTSLGTGVVDVRAGVQAAHETGVEWMVVEQDTLRNLDAMDTVRLSSLYLREAGLL